MENIKAPRGTRDIIGAEAWKWSQVFNACRSVAEDYGYKEIILPIFEHTELFSRGIGDATDVVEKEMYTFLDRSDRSITLRPELTASMMRSYLENEMRRGPQPVKLWSYGPMFRYERPQKGRYRQFTQVDFEVIGVQNALADVETIDTAMEIYRRLGLTGLSVHVNSVGCPVCRPIYRQALCSYLAERSQELCETCRQRMERNPLRVLDCKNPACRAVTDGAPGMVEHLCEECALHFRQLTDGLERIGASGKIDNRLVRGLDYYTKTAYEVLAGELGAQNAVCGGGRYDNLAESIGGPHVPGVGFASGVERIILTLEGQGVSLGKEPSPCAYVIAASEAARVEAALLAHELRQAGFSAELDYAERSLKTQMKAASLLGAASVCIIGEDEIAAGTVSVKNMASGEQEQIERNALLDYMRRPRP